jgi:hypothetical protein
MNYSKSPANPLQSTNSDGIIQRQWDLAISAATAQWTTEPGAAVAQSDDWLLSMPISVGCCRLKVYTHGSRAWSCVHNVGRTQRHHYIIDLVWRPVTRACIPSAMVPQGLSRSDGKPPDDLTLIPCDERVVVPHGM